MNFTVPVSAVSVSTSTEGARTAGSMYSITCTVTKPITLLATPDISWFNPSGTEIGGRVNSSQIGNMTVASVTVQLDPLLASHSGLYTCEVSLMSPSLLSPLNLTSAATVSIQSKFKL